MIDAQSNDDMREIEVTQQVDIPFLDEILLAALGADGEAYIPITPFAAKLGLAKPARQLDRIKRDDTMRECLCKMQIATQGGKQVMQCLRVDMLALWLASIRESSVKEEIRPQLSWYKKEAAKAIIGHFRMLTAIQARPSDSSAITEYDALRDILRLMIDHLSALAAMPAQLDQAIALLTSLNERQDTIAVSLSELTNHLTPDQKSQVAYAVNRIVKDSAGKAGQLNHQQVYAALKRTFNVGSYTEISTDRYDAVLDYLRDLWKRATSGKVPEQQTLF